MSNGKWTSLILITLVLMSGCASEPQSPTENRVLLNLGGEPPTLDPPQAVDATSGLVMKMIFEGLTRIERDGKPGPALAEKIEVSNDGTTYRFFLRKALWSNGELVTAEDFAYAWRLSLEPTYPANYAYQLFVIKNAMEAKRGEVGMEEVGIRVIDEMTLEVELEHPIPYFLELTAFHSYYPVPHKIAAKNPDWAANAGPDLVTNGPFHVVEWHHHSQMILERSTTYWDKAVVRLEGIEISMIEDSNTELQLFEDGKLDWAGSPLSVGLPSDAIPSLKESGILKVEPVLSTYFFKFNTAVFPLSHRKFRRALCLAIHRQPIVDYITQKGEPPALGLVPPPISPKPEGYFKDHDLQEARRLLKEFLEEQGATLEALPTLELAYNTNESHHKIAQIVQQQWSRDLGINVELRNFEWKVYLDMLSKRNYQIGRLSWLADFNDPINFLEVYKYPEGGNNNTGWSNVEYTQLLDDALAERELDKRAQVLLKAETILMDEMPIAPVYFSTTAYVKTARLKGVYTSNLGDVDFKWAYLEPAPSSLIPHN